MKVRAFVWAGACALVALASRSLAYALAPRPRLIGARLEQAVGGPGLVVVATGALVTAFAVAAGLVWIASLSVRERHQLVGGAAPEPLRIRTVVYGAAALLVCSSAAFTLVESYLHWRAGLGWHGIHCLIGPVHRDAIPLLAGCSLVASAAIAAASHLVAWMRRTLEAIARAGVCFWSRRALAAKAVSSLVPARGLLSVRSRGPPLLGSVS